MVIKSLNGFTKLSSWGDIVVFGLHLFVLSENDLKYDNNVLENIGEKTEVQTHSFNKSAGKSKRYKTPGSFNNVTARWAAHDSLNVTLKRAWL